MYAVVYLWVVFTARPRTAMFLSQAKRALHCLFFAARAILLR